MDGVLNINKPAGVTSHDVVDAVRRIFKIRKVGHAGTLDPLATGTLLVCVGQATRIVEFLMDAEKEYEGAMVLGVTTDTEDSSGTVASDVDASSVTRQDIERVLPQFTGVIEQTPPMVSAAHYEGKRLYELARQGKVVDRPPRRVEIKAIEVRDFQPGRHPQATLRVVCSKGVYIRTLFADIGAALGVGAHMSALTRTRIGRFTLGESVELDTLEALAGENKAGEAVISMADALANLPQAVIPAESVQAVRQGRSIPVTEGLELKAGSPALLIANGRVIALAEVAQREGRAVFQPTKVFA